MKKQTRRKFSPAFKAKVALEAVKSQQTLANLKNPRPGFHQKRVKRGEL